MNTIKFAPFNEFVTEQHNVKTATSKVLSINGKEYKFYEPCNLNVFITNSCPNKCKFCINSCNDWTEIQDDEQFLYGLEQSLKLLQDLHVEATITGGEPTLLHNRFVKTIELLKKYGIKERTVSTTGWGLISHKDGEPHLLHELERLGYIHNISISRMSSDERLNNTILGNKNISNEDLRKIGLYSKINGIETRISCNLMYESVSTLDDILNFVDNQESNHISSCLFRELESNVQSKDINYIADMISKHPEYNYSVEQLPAKVEIKNIFDEVNHHPAFWYMETVKGVFYDIDYYKYISQSTGKKIYCKAIFRS